jgi:hypothetical protein
MSNRDRWIIYPLLLFAILLGARDKFMDQAKYRDLSCNELTVTSLDGRPLVTIGGSNAGQVVMYAPLPTGDQAPGEANPGQVLPDARSRIVELGAESAGGFVKVFGPPGAPTLKVGHQETERLSGLVAIDDHGDPLPAESPPVTEKVWGTTMPWDQPATESSAGESGGDSQDEASVE